MRKNGHARPLPTRSGRPPARSAAGKAPRPATIQRVVIADNDSLYRVALRELLGQLYPGAAVVPAASEQELEAALAQARTDLTLVDLGLPGLDGYLSIFKLLKRHPRTRFIAVTGLEPPLAASRLSAFGMAAFVNKRAPRDKLSKVLTAPRRARQSVPASEKKLIAGLLRLTPAETEVFTRLPENASHRQLMEALDVALPTIKTHMSRILAKLSLRNRTEAAIVAQRLALFDAPTLTLERGA